MLLAVSLALASCGGPPAYGVATSELTVPGVHETRRVVLYRVEGASIDDVVRRMRQIGPIDDGGHQFAYTFVVFAWHWDHAHTAQGCALQSTTLDVQFDQTFPEWLGATPADRNEWERWLTATRAHEEGHVTIGAEAAGRIRQAIATQGPKPTCEELDRAANDAAESELFFMRRRHVAYDRSSRHGAINGASLRTHAAGAPTTPE